MWREGHHIILLADNFKGHFVAYKPTNIRVEFFQPNLTPFVQPCDAGVIRTFKAKYCRAFCARAIDLDEAGEPDVVDINILEAMFMAKQAWEEVSIDTINHCWKHTGITAPP
jgi:hypothetical protein